MLQNRKKPINEYIHRKPQLKNGKTTSEIYMGKKDDCSNDITEDLDDNNSRQKYNISRKI